MESSDRFAQLARRDAAMTELAARGRRRAVTLMVLLCLPSPFLVMAANNDSSFASVVPVLLACFGGISYSWSKWKRRPEDSQSIAFVGLNRAQRRATYRSMRRGSRIEDPVVLSIMEAMHQHMLRGLWLVVAATITVGVLGAALAASSGQAGVIWVVLAVAVLVTGAVSGVRWVAARAGVVIAESHAR